MQLDEKVAALLSSNPSATWWLASAVVVRVPGMQAKFAPLVAPGPRLAKLNASGAAPGTVTETVNGPAPTSPWFLTVNPLSLIPEMMRSGWSVGGAGQPFGREPGVSGHASRQSGTPSWSRSGGVRLRARLGPRARARRSARAVLPQPTAYRPASGLPPRLLVASVSWRKRAALAALSPFRFTGGSATAVFRSRGRRGIAAAWSSQP
jgi:hypothetical protein